MLNKNAINILKKNIERHGTKIDFYRREQNAYGEIDFSSNLIFAKQIKGIFHEGEEFFNSVIKSDMGRTESEKQPAIITKYSEREELQINDVCNINGTRYKIISFQDVNLSNEFIDISLELIFDE